MDGGKITGKWRELYRWREVKCGVEERRRKGGRVKEREEREEKGKVGKKMEVK